MPKWGGIICKQTSSAMVAITDHDRALWVTIPLVAILREQIYHESLWLILHKQLR